MKGGKGNRETEGEKERFVLIRGGRVHSSCWKEISLTGNDKFCACVYV